MKWCTGYNKEFFSAGILSSQRSESTNSSLGLNSKKTTGITEFFSLFQKIVENWRMKEANDEFQCTKLHPISSLPMVGMLKHASEVYTLTLFKEFEKEFLKSTATISTFLLVEDDVSCYRVTDIDSPTSHHVSFYPTGFLVTCSCKKFEECGLLCYHCLRVLNVNSVTEIPQFYIKKRWEKYVKKELWDTRTSTSNNSRSGQSGNGLNSATWRHGIVRKIYNSVLKAQDNEEARRAIEDAVENIVCVVDALVIGDVDANAVENEDQEDVSCSSVSILDPSRSKTKGRRQRIKSGLKRKKSKTTRVSEKEFGSKTPNPRLI